MTHTHRQSETIVVIKQVCKMTGLVFSDQNSLVRKIRKREVAV
jgi:hypothetical protein